MLISFVWLAWQKSEHLPLNLREKIEAPLNTNLPTHYLWTLLSPYKLVLKLYGKMESTIPQQNIPNSYFYLCYHLHLLTKYFYISSVCFNGFHILIELYLCVWRYFDWKIKYPQKVNLIEICLNQELNPPLFLNTF